MTNRMSAHMDRMSAYMDINECTHDGQNECTHDRQNEWCSTCISMEYVVGSYAGYPLVVCMLACPALSKFVCVTYACMHKHEISQLSSNTEFIEQSQYVPAVKSLKLICKTGIQD